MTACENSGWREDPGALVAEATADSPIDPARRKGESAVLLLLAMFNISGTLDWDKGWVAPALRAFDDANAKAPTKASLAWYRRRLSEEPGEFANVRGADPVLLRDLAER